MDWLDEKMLGIQLKQLSLKQTLRLYIILGVLLVILAQLVTANLCQGWERLILAGQSEALLSPDNQLLYDMILVLRSYSFIPYTIVAIVMITQQFYQSKIAQPLRVLQQQIKMVAKGKLEVPYYYQSGDEFAAICAGFDQMRVSLLKNQTDITILHQQQRQINAVFSHDLRTPLTVIKGNIQMIQRFQPRGELSPEQLQKSLSKIDGNISRLIAYADTMREIQGVDEWVIYKQSQGVNALAEELHELVAHVVSKDIEFLGIKPTEASILVDGDVVKHVLGNLVTNGQRFAKHKISVTLQVTDGFLNVFVQDDGPGFSEDDLYQATQPYYSSDKQHFGLGLTICQVLTQKHGGVLRLANSIVGGAIISASFAIE